MAAADPFRMGSGSANASSADVVSSTNVVNVVKDESLKNSESGKAFKVSQLDRLALSDESSASWIVSELARLNPFSVREAAASITVVPVTVAEAMQQTAGTIPLGKGTAGGTNTEAKAVNVVKYRDAYDTHVENVVTDRFTVVERLQRVEQEVRLVLELYGLLMAEATRSYGLAEHRTDKVREESLTSILAALRMISSGIGQSDTDTRNSSEEVVSSIAVTGRRVVSIASGRGYEVHVRSTRVVVEGVTSLGVRSVSLMGVTGIEGVGTGVASDVDDNTVENRSTVVTRSTVANRSIAE
jgi:hypothetical protein